MTSIKNILYFGSDDDFYDDINYFLLNKIKKDFNLEKIAYNKLSIINNVVKKNPNIIFIDFTSFGVDDDLIQEVLFLKKISRFKSTLFCALLGDTSDILIQKHLYCSGFQIGFIKGSEKEIFFSNCLYIGIGFSETSHVFAKAENINKSLEVGMCSSLSYISCDDFCIETDLDWSASELNFILNIFSDVHLKKFTIKKHFQSSFIYPFTDNYILSYPLVGPWEDVTLDTIQQETIETWFENNKDKLMFYNGFFRVVSENTKIFCELFEYIANKPFFLEVNDNLCMSTIKEDTSQKRPSIIFIDLNQEGNTGFECVAELINELKKNSDYSPILVISNSPSSADALKKVYGYSSIVCLENKLTVNLFSLFLNKYLEKNTTLKKEATFKASDPLRAIDVLFDIHVTSLSEHEMTFISEFELPMFSVLYLTLPIECFLTLVPCHLNLDKPSSGYHYSGLIHGISEEKTQELRKFVNQIMFMPLEDFSKDSILSLSRVNKKKVEIPHLIEKKNVDSEIEPFKRIKVNGKSKL